MTKSPQEELLSQFQPVFYPKSIAVIGASPNPQKSGHMWVKALINCGFPGAIYPVNSSGGEIRGLKVYTSLKDVPGSVDHVIVSIPRTSLPNLIDECAAKKVKVIHLFTAGFSELGDKMGNELEAELVQKAKLAGFRVIGPNCIGAHCPESRLPYGAFGLAESVGYTGSVGFISQSGSIGGKLVELGVALGIKFSKGVSFGNGIDLDSTDFLEYLAADPKTSVIGAYLEGTRNGRQLLQVMEKVAKAKPLIVWKGGRTRVGAAAARSHTGSLTSSAATWSSALKQAGVIEVRSIEELADNLFIFQQLQRWQGKGVAVAGGLADGGGGITVSAGDTCAEAGLTLPPLSHQTKQKLRNLLGSIGTILHNPVDVSQANSRLPILQEAFKIILSDKVIDLLIIQEDVGVLMPYVPWEHTKAINDAIIDTRNKAGKPVVMVLPPGLAEPERLKIQSQFSQASIPTYPTMERAAKAIMNLSRYSRNR